MLQNQVALVTGSARGIGRSIVERLLQDGAIVYINDLKAEDIESTIQELNEQYQFEDRLFGIEGDVSNDEIVKPMIEKILSAHNRLDILVNNAGITRDGLMMRMSVQDFELVLKVNLTSAFLCSKYASRKMLSQKYGRIINISSVVGVMGNAGQANYSSSKAGMIGLTKSLAKEFGSRGVTVNAIAPGFIETAMTHHLSEEVRNKFLESIPLRRAGTPNDVAGVVSFLCSPDAAYITGQVIHVDGGMVM
ncbi:MAG: 3-oxoacyl-[acyl-carrier-protein] reductase [bacterium]|nr:3-oxoacyl-[acyl-carrier-protein] reductase [bacterium]